MTVLINIDTTDEVRAPVTTSGPLVWASLHIGETTITPSGYGPEVCAWLDRLLTAVATARTEMTIAMATVAAAPAAPPESVTSAAPEAVAL